MDTATEPMVYTRLYYQVAIDKVKNKGQEMKGIPFIFLMLLII